MVMQSVISPQARAAAMTGRTFAMVESWGMGSEPSSKQPISRMQSASDAVDAGTWITLARTVMPLTRIRLALRRAG